MAQLILTIDDHEVEGGIFPSYLEAVLAALAADFADFRVELI
jgi:hypothetical protein